MERMTNYEGITINMTRGKEEKRCFDHIKRELFYEEALNCSLIWMNEQTKEKLLQWRNQS